MKVNRVVLRKVSNPMMLVELNVEIDNLDGTTTVIQQYARPESMIMIVNSDGETITCRSNKDATHYTGSYTMFRDINRSTFGSADQVVDYTFTKASTGYTVSSIADRTPGVKLFV